MRSRLQFLALCALIPAMGYVVSGYRFGYGVWFCAAAVLLPAGVMFLRAEFAFCTRVPLSKALGWLLVCAAQYMLMRGVYPALVLQLREQYHLPSVQFGYEVVGDLIWAGIALVFAGWGLFVFPGRRRWLAQAGMIVYGVLAMGVCAFAAASGMTGYGVYPLPVVGALLYLAAQALLLAGYKWRIASAEWGALLLGSFGMLIFTGDVLRMLR